MQHFDDFGCCMFCQIIDEELQEQKRIVLTSEHFVAVELFASPAPFCTHIYPRRHMASFSDVSAKEIVDLGRVLRTVLALLLDFADRELPGAINENAGWIVVKPRSLRDGAE